MIVLPLYTEEAIYQQSLFDRLRVTSYFFHTELVEV